MFIIDWVMASWIGAAMNNDNDPYRTREAGGSTEAIATLPHEDGSWGEALHRDEFLGPLRHHNEAEEKVREAQNHHEPQQARGGSGAWQYKVGALTKKYAVYVPDLVFFGGVSSAVCGTSMGEWWRLRWLGCTLKWLKRWLSQGSSGPPYIYQV